MLVKNVFIVFLKNIPLKTINVLLFSVTILKLGI